MNLNMTNEPIAQIYFDLLEARRGAGLQKDIAISTIEQISPFPFDLFRRECEKYPKARLVFAQEEHEDQGTRGFPQLGRLVAKFRS